MSNAIPHLLLENFTISYVKPEDSEKLVKYLNEIGGETNNLSFKKNEFFYSVAEEENYIKGILENKNGIILIVKNNLGDIIAESTCISNGRRSSHVFTMGLTVKKKYWRNGIGTALIKKIIEDCPKLGCEKIMLHVFHTNINAIKLYRKLGFKIEGSLKKDVKINEIYIDTYIMYKFL